MFKTIVLLQADSESTRMIHEAYQFLTAKKKNDGLTQQELADYRRVFNKFDKDSGGSIDADELGTLIRVLGFVSLNVVMDL